MSDTALCDAISEMEQGLVDARLGGQIVKKRVALQGRGKRGGARVICATNLGSRWFFLYGFAKYERSNIERAELRSLQEVAKVLLALDDQQIATAVRFGELVEICHGNTDT